MLKFISIFKKILLIYLIYALIAGIFIFLKDYPIDKRYVSATSLNQYYSDQVGPDRAMVIDDRNDAWEIRMRLLDEAEKNVRILNYGIYPGKISKQFYGKILETANRGVKIDIVFDGLVNNLKGPINQTRWALTNHPNIRLKFYERPNLLKPWTFNNRLHDKLWIIDEEFALSSGRNLADKFYLNDNLGVSEQDRDVIIWKSEESTIESGLDDFIDYFHEVWESDYSKAVEPPFSKNLGEKKAKELTQALQTLGRKAASNQKSWMEMTVPTNKVSLVTNPLGRYKKKPIVLETLAHFFQRAQDEIIAQSPYFVLNEELQNYIKSDKISADFHLLTNSYYSSPNSAAMAGFWKYSEKIFELADQIYTYQGNGSIHGKSYLIDDRISMIGSMNLDPRSSFLSTENLVVIDSEPLNNSLRFNMCELMEKSSVLKDDKQLVEKTQIPKEPSFLKKAVLLITRILLYSLDEIL